MTTIPGHNIVIQQSGAAHEAAHPARQPQPNPEQLASQQELKETLEKTQVQESGPSENLKADTEESRKETMKKKPDKRKKKEEDDLPDGIQDPDLTGRLLDTIV